MKLQSPVDIASRRTKNARRPASHPQIVPVRFDVIREKRLAVREQRLEKSTAGARWRLKLCGAPSNDRALPHAMRDCRPVSD